MYLDIKGIQNCGLFVRLLNVLLSKLQANSNDNQDCFKLIY